MLGICHKATAPKDMMVAVTGGVVCANAYHDGAVSGPWTFLEQIAQFDLLFSLSGHFWNKLRSPTFSCPSAGGSRLSCARKSGLKLGLVCFSPVVAPVLLGFLPGLIPGDPGAFGVRRV